MSKREQVFKQYLQNAGKAEEELLLKGYIGVSQDSIWQILIFELEHYDVPTEVFFHELSCREIVEIVLGHITAYGIPLEEIEHVPSSITIDGSKIEKADIKNNGKIWTIHLNDADPFPSSPHAHNHEYNVKLHLGTGELYRKWKVVGSISRKELEAIRNKIKIRMTGITLPKMRS